MGDPMTDEQDRLYLDLKGARERLCRASVHVPAHWQSDLSQAVAIVDNVGSSLVPIPGAQDVKADERSPLHDDCTCRHAEASLGRFEGVDMGRGIVRIGTTPNCPVHDACRGFTKEYRATLPSWSNPWCPKHPKGACPDRPTVEPEEDRRGG